MVYENDFVTNYQCSYFHDYHCCSRFYDFFVELLSLIHHCFVLFGTYYVSPCFRHCRGCFCVIVLLLLLLLCCCFFSLSLLMLLLLQVVFCCCCCCCCMGFAVFIVIGVRAVVGAVVVVIVVVVLLLLPVLHHCFVLFYGFLISLNLSWN